MAEEKTATNEAGTEQQAPETTQEKVFSQADLDAIVKDRLSRERKKYADYDKYKAAYEAGLSNEEKAKNDLEAMAARVAELEAEKTAREELDAHNELVKQVLEAGGIDAKYAPLLTAKDEEGLKAQAALLGEASAGKFSQPSKNERRKPSSNSTQLSAKEAFGEWMEENDFIF